jgi:hypothetical protein
VTAPRERWVLLGRLLEGRRQVLGYTYRAPEFERDTRINRRLSADIETAAKDRVNHFTEGSLRLIAHGYQVPYESLVAVLRGERDELTAAPAPAYGPDGWQPPIADPARRDAAAEFATPIMKRLVELLKSGVMEPTGKQMFPDAPGDAQAWDGIGRRMDVWDRAWFIGDLRRWEAARGGNSGTGVTGA